MRGGCLAILLVLCLFAIFLYEPEDDAVEPIASLQTFAVLEPRDTATAWPSRTPTEPPETLIAPTTSNRESAFAAALTARPTQTSTPTATVAPSATATAWPSRTPTERPETLITPTTVESGNAIVATRAARPTRTAAPTAAIAALSVGVEQVEPDSQTAQVTRVIDGDTIEVRMAGRTYRVRYIGVNTPEIGDTCADEATATNAALVEGATVTLVKDISKTDRYGRLLRYVYVGETFVNAELVSRGYAEPSTYPPDVTYSALFVALASDARGAGVGCHAAAERVSETMQTFYVTGVQGVNIRSCASTDCAILATLPYGEAVGVVDTVNDWHVIRFPDGLTGFMASWLTSASRPVPAPSAPVVREPATPQPPAPEQPAPIAPPAPEQLISQPPVLQEPQVPPQEPPPAPLPGPAFTCDCSRTCPMMVSCEEAYFQLNQCGCSVRDGDSDGVPCEEICPGG